MGVFLKGLVELGIPGVEMIDQQYWSMANDLGLTIATHGGHATLTDGLNKPENHERIEEELLKNLELAQEYNIVNLICFSGDRYEGITDEEGLDITARGLERVAKAAEAAGITLVLELLNSKSIIRIINATKLRGEWKSANGWTHPALNCYTTSTTCKL